MKSILLSLLFTATANAAFIPGSECGLTDTWGGENDEWNFTETVEIYKMSERRLDMLPMKMQKQLIKAAAIAGSDAQDMNVVEAVAYLKENSEGEEVYYKSFDLDQKEYSAVQYYGGGNMTGSIFKKGSDVLHAEISDGDINCQKREASTVVLGASDDQDSVEATLTDLLGEVGIVYIKSKEAKLQCDDQVDVGSYRCLITGDISTYTTDKKSVQAQLFKLMSQSDLTAIRKSGNSYIIKDDSSKVVCTVKDFSRGSAKAIAYGCSVITNL